MSVHEQTFSSTRFGGLITCCSVANMHSFDLTINFEKNMHLNQSMY